MKTLTTLFIVLSLLTVATPAFAKCAPGSIQAYPPSQARLPENGRILLVASGTSQAMLMNTIENGGFVFFASKHVIPAVVEEVFVSASNQTSVVLRPKRPFRDGMHVSLKGLDRFHWRVAQGIDHSTPFLLPDASAPSMESVYSSVTLHQPTSHILPVSFYHIEYGCGPAVHFTVSSIVASPDVVYIDVTLDADGEIQRARVPYDGTGTLKVGHGMCGGAFLVQRGVIYDATFVAYDAAGNASAPMSVTLYEPPVAASLGATP